MQKFKKLVVVIIIINILMNSTCLIFNKSYAINQGNIDFEDENFKTALINNGIDTNGDGEISYEEAINVSDLYLYDKGISDISGIEYFENLQYLDIRNNYIEDISKCVNLLKLQNLFISHNKIDSTPLRTIDNSVKSIIESMVERGVHIEGIYNQMLDYNSNLIDSQPEYKVLFVYVTEIDADVSNNGNILNYKHTLTEEEKHWFDLQKDIFEKAIEKMSNYSVNIVTEVYNTTKKITKYGGYEDNYWLCKDDITEIEDISNNYDTIFVCSIYDNEIIPHNAGGMGTRGEAMVYFANMDQDDVKKLENDKIGDWIPSMVHEFIHSVEIYGMYMDFEIWEWHSAQRYYAKNYYGDNEQNILGESMYLQGISNPNNVNETGIVKELWEIPLSRIFGKDIVISQEYVDLEIGSKKTLYCAAKKLNTTPADYALWTFKNIIWSSDNESIATVDENGIITAKSFGQCTITATDSTQIYSKTCIINVLGNGNEKQITKIEIKEKPTKKLYIQNYEDLDLSGGIIKIIYNDGSEDTISLTNENIHVSGFDNTKIGTNTITIEYEGKTTTFDVQIISKQAVGIEVTTLPTKKQYIQNYENIDLTGGVLTITYNDETTDTTSLTNENVHVSGFNNTKISTNTITVEYEGKTTTFDVQIISKQAFGIEVTTLPTKKQYTQNYENLDLTGGVLTITYNDETTDTINLTNEHIHKSGFDNTKIGTNTITIEYEGKTTTFDVQIISKQAIGIGVTTLPTKKQYIQNYENLDLTGGILTITYNDETTDTIGLTNENIHKSGFDNTKIGTNTITVEYEGKTTTFDVQILSKQITGIEVSKLPTKTKYIQNYENIDLTGGILSIVYNDKTTDSIDMTNENVKVSNFDNTVLGKNTLTVEYNGIKTNFNVEIISKSVTKIELTTRPIKTKYIQNTETIDLTGGVLTVTYNDKTTDTLSLKNENVKVTGFNNNSVGNNILTIEYEGAKTSFTIEIISNNAEKNKGTEIPSKDKTVAVGTLPQTGEKNIIFIVSIMVSFILAILLYKKWKEYKNI